jgi:hypothetical protein
VAQNNDVGSTTTAVCFFQTLLILASAKGEVVAPPPRRRTPTGRDEERQALADLDASRIVVQNDGVAVDAVDQSEAIP